jgi:hypothetical protein
LLCKWRSWLTSWREDLRERRDDDDDDDDGGDAGLK